jgi:hypothetical protein
MSAATAAKPRPRADTVGCSRQIARLRRDTTKPIGRVSNVVRWEATCQELSRIFRSRVAE